MREDKRLPVVEKENANSLIGRLQAGSLVVTKPRRAEVWLYVPARLIIGQHGKASSTLAASTQRIAVFFFFLTFMDGIAQVNPTNPLRSYQAEYGNMETVLLLSGGSFCFLLFAFLLGFSPSGCLRPCFLLRWLN